ncbi:nuclear transport factor 2 family protein [Conexibacter arvalis]|uniref:2-(1,2-epoxy-1,2-dihydrophenyl)acetyl-CoA isomerase n=1 Tax=Conexibacter arvalis TaxID=912552 RepID=A0A840IIQ9_9ACTN|nr:polyketide cyclase [Conexibacter arvalis]MBB4663894.1 2-(1,2-epoxy-1,2-dihydrophenyl)acetyl-CoA isomerase [Conexibacter arvalis]
MRSQGFAMPASSAEALRRAVERLYEALGGGDGEVVLSLLAPEFEGRIAAGMPAGAGVHRGAEAMVRDGWWSIGRAFKVVAEPQEWVPCADGRLLVTGAYRGVARGTSARVDARFAHLWSGGAGGLTALEQWTDTALWRVALSEGGDR